MSHLLSLDPQGLFISKREELFDFLSQALAPREIELRLNQNRVTYLSAVVKKDVLKVSVHRVFLEADFKIWHLIVSFCRRPTIKIRRELEFFIENLPEEIWALFSKPSRKTIRPEGASHHLQNALNKAIEWGFSGNFPVEVPQITWGQKKQAKRHLCLGTYHASQNLIRIHRALDDEKVPFNYLVSVIHHELLHAVYRPQVSPSKRRIVHTRDFLYAERQFFLYEWAKKWEQDSLPHVLKLQRRRRKK